MKKMSIILFALQFLLFSSFVHAGGKGTTGATFLKIPTDARESAMGGCILRDPSLHRRRKLCTSYSWWFQNITYQSIIYAQPLGEVWAVVVSLIGLQVTEIEEREGDTEDPLGHFDTGDYAGILSLNRRINKEVSFGASIEVIQERIKDKRGNGYGVSLGVSYTPSAIDGLSLGADIEHITLKKITFSEEGDPLPTNFKVGANYKMFDGCLTLALDINKPIDNDLNIHTGVEYQVARILALRAGHKTGPQDIGSGLSAGAGFGFTNYQLDYAWAPYGELGDTHQVSVGIRF
jgi:hypothetical protein